MAKFKVGDRVNYVRGQAALFYNTKEGRKVISIERGAYSFNDGGFIDIVTGDKVGDDYELALVSPSSPIREVTKREFVSGAYGIVNVSCVDKPMLLPKSRGYTPQEIRNAAQTLIEIADYLDENAKDAA